MTRFIDVPTMSRLVADIGVSRFIGELADAIRDDFVRWPDFHKSARLADHSAIGVIELMPVSDADRYAFKYVNGHPRNTHRGLFTVMAFGVLAEVDTGYPLLLSELTVATALRTCATSLMAARALARPDARRMALIGNGAQSEFQALAFHCHLGIQEIAVYDVDPRATDKLVRNLAAWPGLKIVRATSIAEAVRGADIVTTVTADKALATILTPDMVEPGMHINGVGGDCPGKTELHADVLRGARVFVEYEPQTRVEGDIQQLPADFPVVDLWRVLAGSEAGRQSAEQVTVFDSVGFALEDYSTLRYVLAQARQRGLGVDVELVPEADDPKDLFRHTREGGAKARAPLRRVA
jgi:ornithine cyclodeaminase